MRCKLTNHKTSARVVVCSIAALVVSSSQSAATPVFFNDRTAFNLAAGGGLNFESFEANPQSGPSVTYGNLTFTESGGVNFFTHTAINSFFTAATIDGQHSIWYDDNEGSLSTLTFGLASPVTALGLDIATSANSTVTVSGDVNSSVILAANTPAFFGVIDLMSPFSSVTFSASGGPLVGFDAVSYGNAVPEAGSILMALLGSLGLLACDGRQRRKQ